MAKKLQLQVPTPCHENWENMTPTERGRFCASCQKQVVDFSNKSDREIAMFFKKPSTGSVCGRFMEDQLNRDIEIPKKRIPWLKYFFQIAIPTFLASCDHRTQGKVEVRALSVAPLETKEEFSKQVCTTTMGMPDIVFNGDTLPSSAVGKNLRMRTCTIIEQIDTIDEPPCIMGDVEPISPQEFVAADSLQPIKGKVVDGDGKPIASAGIMVRGTKNGTTTDDNGFFSIYPKSESNDMTLVIAAVGFNTAEMQIKYEGNNFLGNIILVPIRLQFSGEVMVTKVTGDTVTAIRKKNPIKLLQQIFRDTAFNKFRIYPNPIRTNSTLNITWSQYQFGDHLLQLFNQLGQLVFSKEINVGKGAKLFTINMPPVIAGSYFLKLTGKTTGTSYTEKMIVE